MAEKWNETLYHTEETMLHVIWEFHVRKGKRRLFEQYYSGKGKWAALFRKHPGYLGTFLFRNVDLPDRYFLADTWINLRSFQTFKRHFRSQYEALDKKCEEFTIEERCLGYFGDSPGSPPGTTFLKKFLNRKDRKET